MESLTDRKQSLDRERDAVSKAGKLHLIHWSVISLSLLLTFAAWYFSKQQVDEKIEFQFTRESDQVVELVSERMRKYEDGLWGGVSAIQARGGDISYKDWLTFANSLQIDLKYPGINGIGVVHYVAPDKLGSYLKDQRQDRPNFHLHPEHKETEFWPITAIEPVSLNAKAIGLDMAHEENRHTAAKRARDSGSAQITGPIVLVQDEGRTPGFLFYAPFYKGGVYETQEDRRENITGLVYAPFVVKKLMAGTLEKDKRHVGISIVDGNELLYDEHVETETDFDPDPLYTKTYSVELYGREWSFDIRSTKSFRHAASNSQPLIILAGGIFIDSLLFALFLVLSRANRRAIAFADRMTSQLRETVKRVESTNAELARRNAELDEFTFVASHDLQEPLRKLISYGELLEEDLGDNLTDEAKEDLGFISDAASRMQTLVEDLLTLSRAGRAEIERARFPLDNSVSLALEALALRVKEIDPVINRDDLPEVRGDANLMSQVYQNLIGNALKFRGDNQPLIRLTAEADNGHWILGVLDNGVGIDPKYAERIFTPFQRLHGRGEYPGSGIGLAICRKIVERHNGRIWVESELGEGSHFRFTMGEKGTYDQPEKQDE